MQGILERVAGMGGPPPPGGTTLFLPESLLNGQQLLGQGQAPCLLMHLFLGRERQLPVGCSWDRGLGGSCMACLLTECTSRLRSRGPVCLRRLLREGTQAGHIFKKRVGPRPSCSAPLHLGTGAIPGAGDESG